MARGESESPTVRVRNLDDPTNFNQIAPSNNFNEANLSSPREPRFGKGSAVALKDVLSLIR